MLQGNQGVDIISKAENGEKTFGNMKLKKKPLKSNRNHGLRNTKKGNMVMVHMVHQINDLTGQIRIY